MLNSNKGVSLIALIIAIIVLLIVAVATITMAFNKEMRDKEQGEPEISGQVQAYKSTEVSVETVQSEIDEGKEYIDDVAILTAVKENIDISVATITDVISPLSLKVTDKENNDVATITVETGKTIKVTKEFED